MLLFLPLLPWEGTGVGVLVTIVGQLICEQMCAPTLSPASVAHVSALPSSSPLQDKLGPQCMKSLEDQVASIRDATAHTLAKIGEEFGPEWTKEHLVPQVCGFVGLCGGTLCVCMDVASAMQVDRKCFIPTCVSCTVCHMITLPPHYTHTHSHPLSIPHFTCYTARHLQ